MTTEELEDASIHTVRQRDDKPSHVPARMAAKKKVWIDIDNSPHVPFFLPIIDELQKHGVELVLTARNIYQVRDLLEFHRLSCKMIGKHYGRNKALKVLGTCLRGLQLLPTAGACRPDLAISHGSRAQVLTCKMLGIPTMMMHDYEFSTKTGFLETDWVLMPDVIPDGVMTKKKEGLRRYPGLKEDVYVPRFRPDAFILRELGVSPEELLVVVRPPATEAHYHNPESEVLFAETLRLLASAPNVRVVTLPRNARQGEQIRGEWSQMIASGRMLVPDAPLDGLNLIWFSDLVISGGGTMNREAAALGVPVYSIFRGRIGAVDRYLADQGRMILLESAQDVQTKIKLVRWNRPAKPENRNLPALECIVDSILSALGDENGARRLSVVSSAAEGAKSWGAVHGAD